MTPWTEAAERVKRYLLVLLAAGVMSGCGQKEKHWPVEKREGYVSSYLDGMAKVETFTRWRLHTAFTDVSSFGMYGHQDFEVFDAPELAHAAAAEFLAKKEDGVINRSAEVVPVCYKKLVFQEVEIP